MRLLFIEMENRDWVKRSMWATMGKFGVPKQPLSDEVFERMLMDEHSCIEEMRVRVAFVVDERVHQHMIRHEEIGKYVTSFRPDRFQGTDLVLRYNERPMMLSMNLKRLIEICRQRLCSESWKDTIELLTIIKKEVALLDPVLDKFLMPKCGWLGFCPACRYCDKFKFWQSERIKLVDRSKELIRNPKDAK